jgi:hypothetical protein
LRIIAVTNQAVANHAPEFITAGKWPGRTAGWRLYGVLSAIGRARDCIGALAQIG